MSADALRRVPPVAWRVDGLIPDGGLTALTGAPGTFKTVIVLDMLLSIATGRPWHGHAVMPGPVVYCAGEGARGLADRVSAWEAARGHAVPPSYWTLPLVPHLMESGDVEALITALLALPARPVVVVIDTLSRAAVGADENSSKDMGLMIEAADRIRRAVACAVVIIHHSPKHSNGLRGSSALLAAVDAAIQVEGGTGADAVTMVCLKMKDGEVFAPIPLVKRLVDLDSGRVSVVVELSAHHQAATNAAVKALLLALRSGGSTGLTSTQWRHAATRHRVSPATYYRVKKVLLADGRVLQSGVGKGARYTLPGQVLMTLSHDLTESGVSPSVALTLSHSVRSESESNADTESYGASDDHPFD